MVTIAPEEAGKRFEELLRRAENGEIVSIERDGRVVARIVPVSQHERVDKLMQRLNELRASMPSLGAPIKDLIDEGRR